MSERRCLQCGQTREEVKKYGTFCATLSGYEAVEGQDEWDRHHWRDWSNAELKRFGIHPSLWEANRRTGIYSLEGPIRTSSCMKNGHTYPKPWHPPMPGWLLDALPKDVCTTCYTQQLTEES